MSEMNVVMLALGLGVPLFFALILTIIVVAGKARPTESLGPRQAVQLNAQPCVQSGSAPGGRWNAQILAKGPFGAMGGSLGSASGQFEVAHGNLSFIPAGQNTPTWTIPCHQIAARANTAFSFAGVLLWTPLGQLRCNVSREHINLYSRNTIKTLREPRYYREFVEILVANRARWA